MAMCGEVFVSVPPAFAEVTDMLGDHLLYSGWAAPERYRSILNEASVVLSTAHQEFFGIAVTEAVAAGAHPVFPNRLVYPERIADFGADPGRCLYDSPAGAVDLIVAVLRSPVDPITTESARGFDWDRVAPRYDAALSKLVSVSSDSSCDSTLV
jgi:hypothetical protein